MLTDNITRDGNGNLFFANHNVAELAQQYGTPLYLMDEERIRGNCRMYLRAFAECFGTQALPLYASKANSFKQIYRIMKEEGMGVDTVSLGEIHTALEAGFPADRIFYHGDGKCCGSGSPRGLFHRGQRDGAPSRGLWREKPRDGPEGPAACDPGD